MELPTSSVRYGGMSRLLPTCPRCDQSADKHPLAGIEPTSATTKGVTVLADWLTKRVLRLNELQQETRTEFMLGALIASSGGKIYAWVAHSGENIIDQDSIADWTVIKEMPAELGDKYCYDVKGRKFTPTFSTGHRRTQCAAAKLLCNLFKEVNGATINSIHMTELWWKNVVTKKENPNRQWDEWEPVESCDSCKQFIPQMLCTSEEGMEDFKPIELLPKGTQKHKVRCESGHEFDLAVPDGAWAPFSLHAKGVKADCKKCNKAVYCVDPSRKEVKETACIYCNSVAIPMNSIPLHPKQAPLKCDSCNREGLYTKYQMPQTGQEVAKGKKLNWVAK